MRVLSLILVLAALALEATATVPTITEEGNYSIAKGYKIYSETLSEDRAFYVSTPIDYDQSDSTYPVLILLDGKQNIEHSVASARMLAQWRGIPGIIVVAIPSTNRVRDFTPSKDANYSSESGGASNFATFIENEIMSFVDANYRTHPYRIIEGHSLGGAFVLSQFLQNNAFYNAYIAIGPSLWWNDWELVKQVEDNWQSTINSETPIFLGIGQLDGGGMQQDLTRFANAISRGNSNVEHRAFPNEGHMSATLPSVYDGLAHIFKGAIYSEKQWGDFNPESFLKFLKTAQSTYGSSAKQTGEVFAALANHLIAKKDYAGAIVVLKENLKHYPENLFNYEELANAYALNDQSDMAISVYRDAILAASNEQSDSDGLQHKYKTAIKLIEEPAIYSREQLLKFEGCYQSEPTKRFDFYVENEQLFGRREGWQDFRLFNGEANQFYMRVQPGLTFEFEQEQVRFSAFGIDYNYSRIECGELVL